METIGWGILGTGDIAGLVAEDLADVPGGRLAAVGSRAPERAARFAERHGAERAHGSYAGLVEDPAVDVVHVTSPHPWHREHTLLALEAGKAVLCEKPFSLNAPQAREMIAAARDRGLFLMEAMWTRFLPAVERVRAWLEEGAIGEPRLLQADFGFRPARDPASRLFDPRLGGGALLDIGVYPLSLASMVLGPVREVRALGHLGETGVDEQGAVVTGHGEARHALLGFTFLARGPTVATVTGTAGRITLHRRWWSAERATLERADGETETCEAPFDGHGYGFQAAHVGACLREERTESPVMGLDETLGVVETMDRIRAAWGIRYPGETASDALDGPAGPVSPGRSPP